VNQAGMVMGRDAETIKVSLWLGKDRNGSDRDAMARNDR